jgi:hypothetical protein
MTAKNLPSKAGYPLYNKWIGRTRRPWVRELRCDDPEAKVDGNEWSRWPMLPCVWATWNWRDVSAPHVINLSSSFSGRIAKNVFCHLLPALKTSPARLSNASAGNTEVDCINCAKRNGPRCEMRSAPDATDHLVRRKTLSGGQQSWLMRSLFSAPVVMLDEPGALGPRVQGFKSSQNLLKANF